MDKVYDKYLGHKTPVESPEPRRVARTPPFKCNINRSDYSYLSSQGGQVIYSKSLHRESPSYLLQYLLNNKRVGFHLIRRGKELRPYRGLNKIWFLTSFSLTEFSGTSKGKLQESWDSGDLVLLFGTPLSLWGKPKGSGSSTDSFSRVLSIRLLGTGRGSVGCLNALFCLMTPKFGVTKPNHKHPSLRLTVCMGGKTVEDTVCPHGLCLYANIIKFYTKLRVVVLFTCFCLSFLYKSFISIKSSRRGKVCNLL